MDEETGTEDFRFGEMGEIRAEMIVSLFFIARDN
jgi:hypothetical protein